MFYYIRLTHLSCISMVNAIENSERRKFWQSRYAMYGHTGWNDCAIYAYDQLERIERIRRGIKFIPKKYGVALDFGCGSGDFSDLLLRFGFRVWGYDPYVKPDINSERFSYLSSPEGIRDIPEKVDIILSITVLDHIVNQREFLSALKLLRKKISVQGRLFLIEYAIDGHVSRPRNDYQSLRQIVDWRQQFDAAGWTVRSIVPVPTIPESPAPGYLAFRRCPSVRLLRRVVNRRGRGSDIARSLLNRRAAQVFRKHGLSKIKRSPLKLMICRPST